jgi:hypothetical protein
MGLFRVRGRLTGPTGLTEERLTPIEGCACAQA